MKNTYKFHFVGKVAGTMFLRINFFIDTNLPPFQRRIGTTLFQHCRSTFKWCWSDVKNETNSKIGISTWHKIETMSAASLETMLDQRSTKSMQPFFNVAQCRFNVVSTLIWRYLNVISTWPQRQLKLYKNQSG